MTTHYLAPACGLALLVGVGGCFSPSSGLETDTDTDDGTAGDDMDSATSTSGASDPSAGSNPSGADDPSDPSGVTDPQTSTTPLPTTATSGDDPCGGTCANGVCAFDGVCECDEGWEGDDCDVDIDDCAGVDCGNGACVDEVAGWTCECDEGWEGDACDALQMPLCLIGPLTVTDALDVVNGYTATGVFEPLEGQITELRVVFEVADSFVSVGSGDFGDPSGQLRTIETANLGVESPAPALAAFGADFAGTAQEVILVNGPDTGFTLGNMVSPTAAEYWGLETSGVLDMPIAIDPASGFPALLPSTGAGSGNVYLRRYQTGTPLMTDFAQATWAPELRNGPACTM